MANEIISTPVKPNGRSVILQRYDTLDLKGLQVPANISLGSVDTKTNNYCPPNLLDQVEGLQEYFGYILSADAQTILLQALNGVANTSSL